MWYWISVLFIDWFYDCKLVIIKLGTLRLPPRLHRSTCSSHRISNVCDSRSVHCTLAASVFNGLGTSTGSCQGRSRCPAKGQSCHDSLRTEFRIRMIRYGSDALRSAGQGIWKISLWCRICSGLCLADHPKCPHNFSNFSAPKQASSVDPIQASEIQVYKSQLKDKAGFWTHVDVIFVLFEFIWTRLTKRTRKWLSRASVKE